jgi:purine-nucleoside phosphorylase
LETKIGIILGSGLNKLTEELSSPGIIYQDENSFHKFKILSGKINEREIILFSGRRHFYEGYTEEKILENIDTAKKLGVNFLILTNAAGGINHHFRISDLMLITSHWNLINKKIPVLNNGSMYDKKINEFIKNISEREKIRLQSGSYCCSPGPMYETRSEVRFLNKFGIDAVGMSTIPEIIYANKIGIRTMALSCITNLLSENSASITSHNEVLEAGIKAYESFSRLIKKVISSSDELNILK